MPRCEHCGHDDLPVRAFLAVLSEAHTAPIMRVLARIERLITTEGEIIVSEIDDAETRIETAESALFADLARELTDFTNAVAGKLTDEEKARADAIVQRLNDADTQINAADPAPATPPTSEGDSTVPA